MLGPRIGGRYENNNNNNYIITTPTSWKSSVIAMLGPRVGEDMRIRIIIYGDLPAVITVPSLITGIWAIVQPRSHLTLTNAVNAL